MFKAKSRYNAILVLALVAALPVLAAPSTGDTQAAKPDTKKAVKGPDCAEPLKDAAGKPTGKYDPRCTEEMIKVAKAKKKADAASAKAKADYDLTKIEGLEGLGKTAEGEAAPADKEYGTVEDIYGVGRSFDARKSYSGADEPGDDETDDKADDAEPERG